MARIKVPKPLAQTLNELTAQETIEPQLEPAFSSRDLLILCQKYGATDSQGRYLHWHDF